MVVSQLGRWGAVYNVRETQTPLKLKARTENMGKAVPVVIIAGGAGKRIGGRKPLQLLAGATLLDHAIAKAECYSQIIAVASGAEKFSLPEGIRVLPDQIDFQGPIAGLEAALNFGTEMDADHVMIMPCDTAFLPGDLLSMLYGGIGNARSAVPKYSDRLHPACSLWRTDVIELLPEYLATGRRSLIGFAELAQHVTVEIPTSSVDPFFNINTVDELALAEKLFVDLRLHK